MSKHCLVRAFIVYMYAAIIHTNGDVTMTKYSLSLSLVLINISNDLCCSFFIVHLKVEVVYVQMRHLERHLF